MRGAAVSHRWPEPFGLVMIEAMACGTPVVAFRAASVPEIIDDGVSGFIVDNIEQAVAAVSRVGALDRTVVRACFDRRFTVERMARDYLEIYRSLPGVGLTRFVRRCRRDRWSCAPPR